MIWLLAAFFTFVNQANALATGYGIGSYVSLFLSIYNYKDSERAYKLYNCMLIINFSVKSFR
jgi:hypothetical protein